MMQEKKVEEKVPKIAPVSGYLRAQHIRCGRSNCHCKNSNGHGPYYYRVITVDGRKRKKYVKKDELSEVQAGIGERHKQLTEIRKANQQAKQTWRMLKTRLRQLEQQIRIAGY